MSQKQIKMGLLLICFLMNGTEKTAKMEKKRKCNFSSAEFYGKITVEVLR